MEYTKNLRIFVVRYLAATHHAPFRIKLIDTRFDKSIILHRDYSKDTILEQGIEWLTNAGINVIGKGHLNSKEDVIISDNFDLSLSDIAVCNYCKNASKETGFCENCGIGTYD